jgi:ABC-type lipoprotein export system ATPase subunit
MGQTQTINIIVAGPSGAGKTTLIQTAGQHGIEGLTKWECIGYEKQLRRALPDGRSKWSGVREFRQDQRR